MLGETIVNAMHQESLEAGARFVLITGIEELHAAAIERNIPSLDVSEALSNPAYRFPDDPHLNELGNAVLASEIAEFLRRDQVIPTQH